MFVKKIVEFCIVFRKFYKRKMSMWKLCSSKHANFKTKSKIQIFLQFITRQKNQQKIDWHTLMIDETYVFERFKKLIAIRNVMISKQIYDEKIAKFLVDLIFQILFQKKIFVSFRKKLTIFNENDDHWIDENNVFRFDDKLYLSKRIRFDVL